MTQPEIKAEMAYREAERISIMTEGEPASIPQIDLARQESETWKASYLATKPWERLN